MPLLAVSAAVAPGVKLIGLDVFDASGNSFYKTIASAVDWAIAYKDKYNVTVINLSLGGESTSKGMFCPQQVCLVTMRRLLTVARFARFAPRQHSRFAQLTDLLLACLPACPWCWCCLQPVIPTCWRRQSIRPMTLVSCRLRRLAMRPRRAPCWCQRVQRGQWRLAQCTAQPRPA